MKLRVKIALACLVFSVIFLVGTVAVEAAGPSPCIPPADQVSFSGVQKQLLPLPNECPVTGDEGRFCGRGAHNSGQYAPSPQCTVPTMIVMHTTQGHLTADAIYNYFNRGSDGRGVGSHFGIGQDGRIIQMVEMGRNRVEYAQTVGPIDDHISIEMGAPGNYSSISQQPAGQYQSALKLVKALMKQYSIAPNRVVSHASLGGPGGDPGEGWMSEFRNALKGTTDVEGLPVTDGGSLTSTSTTSGTTGEGDTSKYSDVSECVSTKAGNPTGSPQLPAECANAGSNSGGGVSTDPGTGGSIGNGGKWRFPLKSIDAAQGIATEMAAYAGTFSYGGHSEHAGLDIGIIGGLGSPVYAITDGTIVERTPDDPANGVLCASYDAGCSVQIRHSTDNYQSRYTHIDTHRNIQDGQTVTKGTLLGYIHIWPNNDHLHFELRDQNKKDSQGRPVSVNPRNFYPELQRFPINEYYYGNVRAHTANRGYPWQNDGREFANEYLNHPPCLNDPSGCWAY